MNFIDSQSQNLLSKLLTLPKIKLICTIEGIKIASVWHPGTISILHYYRLKIETESKIFPYKHSSPLHFITIFPTQHHRRPRTIRPIIAEHLPIFEQQPEENPQTNR